MVSRLGSKYNQADKADAQPQLQGEQYNERRPHPSLVAKTLEMAYFEQLPKPMSA